MAIHFGSGDSYLLIDVLPDHESFFNSLNEEVIWHEMHQKGGRVPRDVSIQGSIKMDGEYELEPIYRHPTDEQPELVPWTPTTLKIKEQLEKIIGQELNHALIQRYRGGKDFIGEHSDKTLDIQVGTKIVNYSLGATRTMILRNKAQKGLKQKIRLPHNSLFVLGWKTNREWLHSIKQDKRMDQEKEPDELLFDGHRISLTLRTIATFRNRQLGTLIGQGAKKEDTEKSMDDQKDMLLAFSAENRVGLEFDWNKHYGQGFNSLNFKTLNANFKVERDS